MIDHSPLPVMPTSLRSVQFPLPVTAEPLTTSVPSYLTVTPKFDNVPPAAKLSPPMGSIVPRAGARHTGNRNRRRSIRDHNVKAIVRKEITGNADGEAIQIHVPGEVAGVGSVR